MSGGASIHSPIVPADVARATGGGTGTVRGTALAASARDPRQSDAPVPVPPSGRDGKSMTGEWPLQDFLELGALPGAVPCARLHARQVMWEWGLAALAGSAEIIVSELVTNAVHAARSLEWTSSVRLWLLSEKARVLILVWDANPQQPARVHADEEAESGRGLLLVETISDQWGSFATQETGGKTVWAAVTQ
jgi:anti-sigma regulatory factor (Ser/Thr protein kinase)